jgi:hypothetical protein
MSPGTSKASCGGAAGAKNVPEGKFDLAYSVRASTFRGERQLALEFVDFRVVEETAVEVKGEKVEVVDLRGNVERVFPFIRSNVC